MNLKPMLATDYKPSLVRFPCWIQPKLNGVRMLYNKGRCITRQGFLWNAPVVEHILEDLRGYVPDNVLLDGEAYCHGMPLQEINSAIGIKNLSPGLFTKTIQYHIFDAAFENGQAMTFQQRWLQVCNNVPESLNIKLLAPVVVRSHEEIDKWFNFYRSEGYEGLIIRTGSNHYMHDTRSRTLLRKKFYMDAEATVVSVERGKGRLSDTMGALLCSYGNKSFSVGTGFSDDLRDTIWKSPDNYRQKQIKFKFECLSKEGKPLKPSFIAFI